MIGRWGQNHEGVYVLLLLLLLVVVVVVVRGLLEEYPTFGREKETGLLGALDT